MCGICGIIELNQSRGELRDSIVTNMNDHLFHRGPDEAGFAAFEKCTLAMRRLSIIDLEGGSQPIYNEDKSIAVVFNGEIYNFLDLRKDLEKQGHRFTSNSDSEVLVHLYEEYGLELASYLTGMFAFCLYDKRSDKLILCRDRFGEKPLFYYVNQGRLSFSSEITSLLQNPDIPRILNVNALSYYLKSGIVPEPLTMFQGVLSLLPGHLLALNENGISLTKYFEAKSNDEPHFKDENEAIENLEPLFEKAVTRQMISDVPLGAFLSGGIDSSSVVAMMQKHSMSRIKTFTVKFENAAYDESPIAQEVAVHLNTDHQEIVIPNEGFNEPLFWKLINHFGIPFSDSSCIPTYLITKEIVQHVKVALSGEGGDELFGGYSIFRWWQQINSLKKLPVTLRNLMVKAMNVAADHGPIKNYSKVRKLTKAIQISLDDHLDIPLSMHQMFDDLEIAVLLKLSKDRSFSYPLYKDFFERSMTSYSVRQIMNYRLKYNLPANMLIKVDRMSMANSLEVRAPFLDPILFRASTKLPVSMLLKAGKGKHIIRRMMKPYLPLSVFDHPKQGFAIPLHTYQNIEYQKLANSLFVKNSPLADLLNLPQINQIKDMALSGAHYNSKVSIYRSSQRLWALMMLFGWMKHFKVQLPA